MEKRGQVTVLIIVAIMVIVAAAVYLSLSNQSSTNNLRSALSKIGISQQVNVLENSIGECLKTTLDDAIGVIGIQGGFYTRPEASEDLGITFIPYYYDQGSFLQPSLNKIESEISDFVNEFLPFCIEDIVIEDILLKQESIKTITKINPGEVEIQSDMQITLSKGDQTTLIELTSYPTKLNSKLNEMYEISEYIIDSHREDPEFICINCMADMAEEKGLFVDMLSFEVPFTTLFIISEDTDSTDPKILEFLNKYPESETPIE